MDHVAAKNLPRLARKGVATVLDMVLPPTCLACERALSAQGALCATCWGSVHFCEAGEGDVTVDFAFDSLHAALIYDDVAQTLVRGLKFFDRTDLAPHMAAWMERAAGDVVDDPRAVIVPVPLHRRRLLKRRFNQSAELARALAKRTGQNFEADTLLRIRATPPQVGLGAGQRRANVRGAFAVPDARRITISGRPVVLVDDVFTTGATLDACARALRRAGAQTIHALTFARVA